MAKKIIIIILMISCLSVNVSAAYFQYVYNPPNMFLGYASISKTDGFMAAYDWQIRQYFWDQNPKISPQIPSTYNYRPIIGIWHSNQLSDQLYKFSVNLDINIDTNETGYALLGDANVYLFPADFMDEIDVTTNETQYIQAGFSNQTYEQYELIDARIFYDKSAKMMSVIYYVDKDVPVTLDSYVCVMLPTTGDLGTPTNMTVTTYTGTDVIDSYTNILNDISDKLDQIAGSSGGLTEEQINQAIQDALTAHDQQLEHEVGGKLDQILEQISGITEPYKQSVDQITGALNNVSNIFSYTGFTSQLTLPAATNPLAGNAVLWPAQQIDLAAAYMSLPATMRTLLQYVLRAAILLAAIREVINIIKYAIIGRGEQGD